MQPIQVGAVIIVNHDNYWKCLEEIRKIEDKISRGIQQKGEIVDTPFSKSVQERGGSLISSDDENYLSELKEACKLYEEIYPKKY